MVRNMLQTRYDSGRTLPGMRRFHYFKPLHSVDIQYKEFSWDENFISTFSFASGAMKEAITSFIPKENKYVACVYDMKWWIGIVCDVKEEEEGCLVSCLHPSGPAKSYVCGKVDLMPI